MDAITFRKYQMKDLAYCAKFAAQAWSMLSNVLLTNDINKLMRAYIKLGYYGATWHQVATISGEIVGFLFGRIEKDVSLLKTITSSLSSLFVLLKVLLGRYGRLKQPVLFIKKYLETESLVQANSPKTDAEIVLFAVSSKHQGMGLGRALMHRFLTTARKLQVRKIKVYTDPLSNWKFYEIMGFQKHASFTDTFNSHIERKNSEGYVYVYHF
ncbi:MAG: hypothetical protein BAJALOKI1v1_1430004 [Promethearchaeota archaeon]|nr:MAG: hypothetical protein BAJALOKI1v1_1430004 [Candidatus Lokiarchaeota archaeon]